MQLGRHSTSPSPLLALITSIAVGILATCLAYSNDIHVAKDGSQAPDGSLANPFQSVEAAACEVRPLDTMVLYPGSYHELPSLASAHGPFTMKASGGNATIGRNAGKNHTTLKTVTYNTHLFEGSAAGGGSYFEGQDRAEVIVQRLVEENADVIALQEVWGPDKASFISSSVSSIYPYSFYGGAMQPFTTLNSGLLLLSKHPLSSPVQYFYTDEGGDELTASKGLIVASIEKAGFSIVVVDTHVEAGDAAADVAVRRKQIQALHDAIPSYIAIHAPTSQVQVVVLGDFNIDGHCLSPSDGCDQYWITLLPSLGMKDSFRNAPCFREKEKFTVSAANELEEYFGGGSNKLLDYIFYSHGEIFEVLPLRAEVTKYKSDTEICGYAFQFAPARLLTYMCTTDLSDHYAFMAEFTIYEK